MSKRWMRPFILVCFYFFPLSISVSAGNRPDPEFFFYDPCGYGSQAVFNPVYVILNGGYDIWQVSVEYKEHQFLKYPYQKSWRALFADIKDPIKTVKAYGVKDFIFSEIIPDEHFDPNRQQYFPNYALHMLGGGMDSRKTEEWFRHYGYPYPRLWAVTTMATHHLLNEMIEFGPRSCLTVDPVADLYIFDPLGIILFTNDNVCRFFAEKLHMNDWSLQPSYDVGSGRLANAGQYFMYKYHLTQNGRWSLFLLTGLHELGGVSYTLPDNRCFTLAGGAGVETIVPTDRSGPGVELTAKWIWSLSAFYDINNSLMASLHVSGLPQDRFRLNIYPGLLRFKSVSPGFWTGWAYDHFLVGINFRLIPLGITASTGN